MIDSEPSRFPARALLIAADRYDDSGLRQLRSPAHDVRQLAKTLADPAIGGYAVRSLVNEATPTVLEEIEGFFAEAGRDDLLLLYLSCHGVKDPSGQLHFAAKTTRLTRLASTSMPAEFLYQQVNRSRSRRIVVLLDCCYSGAYPHGHRPRSPDRVGIGARDGRGRVVITSCTATEYAFELGTGEITGTPVPSVFTAAVVEGLQTGEADRDDDGLVSVDDLYGYVVEAVQARTPYQTPELKWGDVRGTLVIARNPRFPAPPPRIPPDGYVARAPEFSASPPGAGTPRGRPVLTRRRGMAVAAAAVLAGGLSVAGWELSRPGPGSKIWEFPVIGSASTALVVDNGIVYATCFYNGKPQRTYLYALRAADGTQLWRFTGDSADNAVIANGVAYITNASGKLCAIRTADGRQIWQYAIGTLTSGPTIAGGVAYVVGNQYPTGNRLFALRAGTGAEIWSFDGSLPFRTQGIADHVLYALGNDGRVYALRADNGMRLWGSLSAVVGETASAPLLSAGMAFTVAADGAVYALRTNDGTTRWRSAPFGQQASILEVVGNDIYLSGGSYEIHVLRASDGQQLWTFAPDGFVPSPIVTDGVALISTGTVSSDGGTPSTTSPGELMALRVSDGKPKWRFPVSGGVTSGPLVSDGMAYIGTRDGHVHAIGIATGTRIWSFPTGGSVSSSLTETDGVVYAGSDDHNLYALDASDGAKLWSYATGGSVFSPPTVDGGTVYVWSADQNVYALRT